MTEPPPLTDVVRDVAYAIRSASARVGSHGTTRGGGLLSPGDVAELRRMQVDDPPAAFWKICARLLESQLPPREPARSDVEKRWGTVLSTLARCKGAHAPIGLGHALASAEVSEARVQTLLRADGDQLADQLRGIAHLADSKGVPLDFADIASLVLYPPDSARGERVRRAIARRFYGSRAKDKT